MSDEPVTSALDIVRLFIDRLSVGDEPGALELLDAEIVVHEAASLPYPGDHVGRDGFLRLRSTWAETWEVVGSARRRWSGGATSWVVMLVELPVIARRSGTAITLRTAEAFRIDGGAIAEMEIFYFDTHELAQIV
jgi:uncharacterized protein